MKSFPLFPEHGTYPFFSCSGSKFGQQENKTVPGELFVCQLALQFRCGKKEANAKLWKVCSGDI